MPGPFHTSKHGGTWGPTEDASPITCQACHYDTTDPSNTGPGGFYYLDTTGTYAVPGGDPYRISSGWQAAQQCSSCHGPGSAATGAGKVLPLRHVNGVRDVAFDLRSTLPAMVWLPAAPNRPTRPYATGTGTSLRGRPASPVGHHRLFTSPAPPGTRPPRPAQRRLPLTDAQPVWGGLTVLHQRRGYLLPLPPL
jgi:hypothetical protein